MKNVFKWLDKKEFTTNAREFWDINFNNADQQTSETFSLFSSNDSIWNSHETLQQDNITKDEWDKIREDNTSDFEESIEGYEQQIANEALKKPSEIEVEIKRLPPDALAFYRPFHYHPYNEWGIYFVLPKFLNYMAQIMQPLCDGYRMFNSKIVATLVLFEVFHHEYYHHLVESTAFTLETILSEFGIFP